MYWCFGCSCCFGCCFGWRHSLVADGTAVPAAAADARVLWPLLLLLLLWPLLLLLVRLMERREAWSRCKIRRLDPGGDLGWPVWLPPMPLLLVFSVPEGSRE